ncbi:hypothetical protein [Pseudomonas putida]|uniref:hypothetical protein n=1 Tax=Pseudomonas putida TaxID=303 RepID=UPI002AC6687A|nr:hypothetical protein [Pseudomonas putida]MDZ5111867.1 hypothetical protein [Pseudomonas putida]
MKKPLSHDEIKQLADDIRLIQNYTQSEGFDKNLFNAKVTPSPSDKTSIDTPIVCAGTFIALLIACLIAIALIEDIPPKIFNLIFVLGLAFIVLSTMSIHKKFSNHVMTWTCGIGMSIVLLVGAGVYTPKEAAAIAQKFGPNQTDEKK